MSLAEDFNMYYGGTYIGYKDDDGKVVPFYVEAVEHNHRIFDMREMGRSERNSVGYGDEALSALRFQGQVQLSHDHSESLSVNNNEDRLVFELPDSRYIRLRNGKHYWVSYRPQRSTKKGISQRRLTGVPSFSSSVVLAMYDTTPDENVFGGCLLRKNGEIHYKGVPVGEFGTDTITLVPEAAHLQRFVQSEIPSCQVTVQAVEPQ